MTKHVRSRRLNISLFSVFYGPPRSTKTRKKKEKVTRRIYSHHHLTRGQERIFICIYHWQVKFSFSFLLLLVSFIKRQGYCFQRWTNCLSLRIVLWVPRVNFHFSKWVYIIILSDKYWENQALGVTKVVRIFSGLLRRMWKSKISYRLRRLHRVFA